MEGRRAPGQVRDVIISFLKNHQKDASVREIHHAVKDAMGEVPASSIRSYLHLNTPETFKRTGHGRYQCVDKR